VKLLEEFEKTAWRPVAPPWAESEKRRQETARRNEELLVAWRRRRIRPAPEEDGAS
jgi:hypothetical protein